MKRTLQTLLVLAIAATACSPAFAAGEKKEERFVLSSAAEPAHRTDNTAAVASVMLVGGLVSFAVTPAMLAYSRRQEREADRFGLELTGDPRAAAMAFVRLQQENLAVPRPGLLYTLWDLGLQVGHAVRSLPDCLAMARTDFASRTSMQHARYLVGDRRLFNRFRKVLSENVYRKDFAQFLETTLAERDQRYRKFGGSPYMGEPNVKESAGGLRDIHTALWLASTKFGTSSGSSSLRERAWARPSNSAWPSAARRISRSR